MTISRSVLLKMRSVSHKICRENQNTHFTFSNFFFFRKLCRLWDNEQRYGKARQPTDDNILRRMCMRCWITKATDKHRICNTDCFSTATIVTRTCLNVTLYAHCLSCLTNRRPNKWERIDLTTKLKFRKPFNRFFSRKLGHMLSLLPSALWRMLFGEYFGGTCCLHLQATDSNCYNSTTMQTEDSKLHSHGHDNLKPHSITITV
jgi:hypothetical protein